MAYALPQAVHDRDCLDSGALEQVQRDPGPVKSGRESFQALGHLQEHFRRRYHAGSNALDIDPKSRKPYAGLLALLAGILDGASQPAHEAFEDRDVLTHRARREAELADLLGRQAGA